MELVITYVIILIVLLFLSMFFSSSDMAYGSTSLHKMQNDYKVRPSSSLKRAISLEKNYDKTISCILFFNDTVNAALDTFSTLLGIQICVLALGVNSAPDTQEMFGLAASMTMLVLKITFGEIISKSLGRIYNYKLTRWFSMPLLVCYYITIPITFIVGGFGNILSFPLVHYMKDIQIKDEELHEMVDEIEEKGIIDEDKAELLRGTIDYASTEAYEIMTPRSKIYAIDKTKPLHEICKNSKTYQHSRIPVYDENIDNIIGFVRSKDIVRLMLENKTESIESIIQPITFIPRSTEINDCLKQFYDTKQNIAIVLDEYGGTDGLISIEDILEEIVGEIWDETDDPDNPVSEKSDGSYIIDGGMNLEDFFDLFDINDEEIDTEYVTVGGFIIELLDDRFASVGDVIHYKNLTMKVIALGKHKTVKKLLVKQDKSEDEQKDKKDN